jgi:hypothetical protein
MFAQFAAPVYGAHCPTGGLLTSPEHWLCVPLPQLAQLVVKQSVAQPSALRQLLPTNDAAHA